MDRSAAYAARWVAKNIVAAELADRAEVQVAYAIGVAHPVSVMVETFGTEQDRPHARPDRARGRRGLRPASWGVPRGAAPAPPDLPEDSRIRPLRPRRPRLHVGADRQGRRAARRRRPLTEAPGAAYRSSRVRSVSSPAVLDERDAAPATRSLIAKVEPMTTARALRGPFDYRLPEAMRRGRRRLDARRAVRAPAGARRGLGAGRQQRGRRGEAARAAARARRGPPAVPVELLALAEWIAAEYCSTLARALALVLPPGATRRLSGRKRRAVARPEHLPVGARASRRTGADRSSSRRCSRPCTRR